MSLINFSCLCMFIVVAQLTESRVLILRDYENEPFFLGHSDRSSAEEEKNVKENDKEPAINSNYKPKRTRSKKAVLQYGRHIYHLDNFANMQELRSKMAQLKPDSVSYDYIDIDDLFRSSDSGKQSVAAYLKDLFIFSNTPVQFCGGDQCDKNLRKFSKHKNYDDDRKHKKTQFGRMKRFQIVNNRHRSKKPQSDSSEEHYEKKKNTASKKTKKKKKKHSSESAESKSNESGSAEKSSGSHKKKKKKYTPKKSSEESVEIKRKPKKKRNEDDSSDASVEKWKNLSKESESNEDFLKKKKRKKKRNYGKSYETKRKTMTVEDDDGFFMQGNKIFLAKEGKSKKKHYDFDRRRRLEHFLPKRYHWDPSEIHDLGYYWFNGPKGAYPEPRPLSK